MKLFRMIALAVCATVAGALPFVAQAQGKIEKPKVSLAVGGKAAFYYLPLTIAERLGYFKDEGLEPEISDFAGGSKALQAVVGGSADVVSGAWENTIDQQPKGLNLQGFVKMGRYPAISVGIVKAKAADYKSPKDLKGMKIGVSAPGSSTNRIVQHLMAEGGLKPTTSRSSASATSSGAIAAVKSGNRGDLQCRPGDDDAGAIGRHCHRSPTRVPRPERGGLRQLRPAGSRAVRADRVHQEESEHRAGADQRDGPRADLAATRPRRTRSSRPCRRNTCSATRPVYLATYNKVKDAFSTDGLFSTAGAENTLKVLAAFNPGGQARVDQSRADLRQPATSKKRWPSTRNKRHAICHGRRRRAGARARSHHLHVRIARACGKSLYRGARHHDRGCRG